MSIATISSFIPLLKVAPEIIGEEVAFEAWRFGIAPIQIHQVRQTSLLPLLNQIETVGKEMQTLYYSSSRIRKDERKPESNNLSCRYNDCCLSTV
jgi:hypothetical protein